MACRMCAWCYSHCLVLSKYRECFLLFCVQLLLTTEGTKTLFSLSLSLYSFHFCPGIESKLDNINQLKVKGLILGPLHSVQADEPSTLDLQNFDPMQGTKEELLVVLEKAHRKGRSSDNSGYATYCHPLILNRLCGVFHATLYLLGF